MAMPASDVERPSPAELLHDIADPGEPDRISSGPFAADRGAAAGSSSGIKAGLVPATMGSVCRQTGCVALAAGSGLCDAHEAHQAKLRERAGLALSNPWPAGLAELVAAIGGRSGAWRHRAACRGQGRVMFPESALGYEAALDLCASCPVVEPCRRAGELERFGVWGATTPEVRASARRRNGGQGVGLRKGNVRAGEKTADVDRLRKRLFDGRERVDPRAS